MKLKGLPVALLAVVTAAVVGYHAGHPAEDAGIRIRRECESIAAQVVWHGGRGDEADGGELRRQRINECVFYALGHVSR